MGSRALLFLLLAAGCSRRPVACSGVDASAGTTTDVFSFGKSTMLVELTGCSDDTHRTIACRQATTGGYKCTCTITKKDGHYSTLDLRTEEELTASNAKDFARAQCEWKLE